MPSTIQIKKFLYSQYFYGGLRIAIGISLPVLVCLLFFKEHHVLGFTMATGALAVCSVDVPGPLKNITYEMLAASFIGFLAAALAGFAAFNIWTLWLTLVPLTFLLSLLVVYGVRWQKISFATLFMMTTTLYNYTDTISTLDRALFMMIGGLWYTCWSASVSKWLSTRIEQQSLAESLYAYAGYLRSRSNFYEMNRDIASSYNELLNAQVIAIDQQETARDIILRNINKYRQGKLNTKQMILFNLFMKSVDLHELFAGTHTDFALLRSTLANNDLMIFLRDLIRKSAMQLEEIALAIMQDRRPQNRINFKAELRAVEYEIELLKRKDYPTTHSEVYLVVTSTFRRIWSSIRLIESMFDNLTTPSSAPQKIPDETIARLISHHPIKLKKLLDNLRYSSPAFKHALRVTSAVAAGFWIGPLLPLSNAYWIIMTIIIILKPGYSITKQRNRQRIIGTLIGCALAATLIYLINDNWLLILLMFTFMVLSYSFQLFNYTISVVFTSTFILFMIHLLAPGDMRIIGERLIDTLIGSFIAIIANRFFPYWEYQSMGHLVKKLMQAIREYLSVTWQDIKSHQYRTLASLQESFEYLNTRKECFIEFASLGLAFQRMMIEPKAKQIHAKEINQLLIQSHILSSQISSFLIILYHLASTQEFKESSFSKILRLIEDQLIAAEKGQPLSDEEVNENSNAKAKLDQTLIQLEKSSNISLESLQNIKLFIHESKQMLSSSEFIRKNASIIQLSTDE